MKYIELDFTYQSDIETSVLNDILAAELGEIGFDSFTQNDNGLQAFIAYPSFKQETLQKKLDNFPLPNTQISYTKKEIEDKNWNEVWEKNYFKPIRIGKECIIRASFHEKESGFKHEIIIDPKMSFGTGNHETTYLMIEEILKLDFLGKNVLDMGCGTAILAILASQKGAKNITAIDIDEWAYENAKENCRLNNITNIQVALGGAGKICEFGKFDVIFANINRNILLEDIHIYADALKENGLLFMSGFYKEDTPALEKECRRNNIKLISSSERNNWAAIKTQKKTTINK